MTLLYEYIYYYFVFIFLLLFLNQILIYCIIKVTNFKTKSNDFNSNAGDVIGEFDSLIMSGEV